MELQLVDVRPLSPRRFASVIGPGRTEQFESTAAAARVLLRGRQVLNVNSTATGGGVAELLQTLLAYARGAGIDARWCVIRGNPRFFEITKRLHNLLYGSPGDGGPLGSAERRHYERTLEDNEPPLGSLARAGDIVVLHDPQTAALVRSVKRRGAHVVWRCHIGIDAPNEHSERAWAFLRPYVEHADAFVFSREQFAPPWVPRDRLAIIAPSIDPFSAKNEHMDNDVASHVLQATGLLAGSRAFPTATFTRRDGSTGHFGHRVDLLGTGPPPPPDAPLVVQASRWDPMKDMRGVATGFARHLAEETGAHLLLAGPAAAGVADDPESGRVLHDCLAAWRQLPAPARTRVHLASVPMDDADEAAAMVNALQRHARVVVQKSLAEGFGLTVAEAMWKARPVVASNVGGIADQIVTGDTGLLVDDPTDLAGFAHSVRLLLDDAARADRMGARAQRRATERFLGDRHLAQWAELVELLVAR